MDVNSLFVLPDNIDVFMVIMLVVVMTGSFCIVSYRIVSDRIEWPSCWGTSTLALYRPNSTRLR
jgi:hypothetical protein